jgi:hypothetical protein
LINHSKSSFKLELFQVSQKSLETSFRYQSPTPTSTLVSPGYTSPANYRQDGHD